MEVGEVAEGGGGRWDQGEIAGGSDEKKIWMKRLR